MKRYLVIILCGILAFGLWKFATAKSMPKGELIAFSYHTSGSAMDSFKSFAVKRVEGKQHVAIDYYRNNGKKIEVSGNIDTDDYIKKPNLLKGLEDIIRQNKIYEWDGFKKNNSMALDGKGFSLSAKFSSGETIEARGTNSFPNGYRDGDIAIYNIFDALIRRTPVTLDVS